MCDGSHAGPSPLANRSTVTVMSGFSSAKSLDGLLGLDDVALQRACAAGAGGRISSVKYAGSSCSQP